MEEGIITKDVYFLKIVQGGVMKGRGCGRGGDGRWGAREKDTGVRIIMGGR